MTNSPENLILAGAAICIFIVCALVALCSTCQTFYTTPNIAAFSDFVYGVESKHISKTVFLFLPFLFLLGGFAVYILGELFNHCRRRPISGLRAIWFIFWAAFMFFIIVGQDIRAFEATKRIGWHGIINPNLLVRTICIAHVAVGNNLGSLVRSELGP